jgi:hypothetical protein
MIIVGTSLRGMSLRKSSIQASTQANVPMGDSAIATVQLDHAFADEFSVSAVNTVEVFQKLHHCDGPVCPDPRTYFAEYARVNALRIVRCHYQVGPERGRGQPAVCSLAALHLRMSQ